MRFQLRDILIFQLSQFSFIPPALQFIGGKPRAASGHYLTSAERKPADGRQCAKSQKGPACDTPDVYSAVNHSAQETSGLCAKLCYIHLSEPLPALSDIFEISGNLRSLLKKRCLLGNEVMDNTRKLFGPCSVVSFGGFSSRARTTLSYSSFNFRQPFPCIF